MQMNQSIVSMTKNNIAKSTFPSIISKLLKEQSKQNDNELKNEKDSYAEKLQELKIAQQLLMKISSEKQSITQQVSSLKSQIKRLSNEKTQQATEIEDLKYPNVKLKQKIEEICNEKVKQRKQIAKQSIQIQNLLSVLKEKEEKINHILQF